MRAPMPCGTNPSAMPCTSGESSSFPTGVGGTATTAGSAAEERVALYNTRKTALDKLAYIADPSTVRVIASCLADTVAPHPAPPGVTSRVFRTSVAQLAGKALRRIVSNPPPSDDVQVWQQWWEQNKDKYP